MHRRSRRFLSRSAQPFTGSTARHHRGLSHHRHLRCEVLEDRRLLSVALGLETDADNAIQLFSTSTALFVENQGQWADEMVRYGFNGNGVNIAFTDSGLSFYLSRREEADETVNERDQLHDLKMDPIDRFGDPADYITHSTQFNVQFDGANVVTPVGLQRAESYFNYYIGDQANWRSNVPGYEIVAYENLYAGIDLHMFGRRDSLKYEFHVAPGVDYRQIAVSYDGIDGLWIDDAGALHVQTELGELVDDAPYIYQTIAGQQTEVAGRFALVDADTYTFEITAAYDPNVELIIDPDIAWSTYLGGSGNEEGWGIAVDSGGNALVTGRTWSPGWVSGGWDTSLDDSSDAFVVKLSADGGHLWSTYLGGSSGDEGYGIAVDSGGNALVTGMTWSSEWVSGGWDTSWDDFDGFVVKLSAGGGHLWSTYLGGDDYDMGYGIAVDSGGNAMVTGWTTSSEWVSGGWDTSLDGSSDAFVVKLSAGGSHLWSTYLGGSGMEEGNGIAVDSGGNALVTGDTDSSDWISGGWDTSLDDFDGFVVKLSAGGGHLWSTYLGGSGMERGWGITVDRGGNALVTGETLSSGWVSGGWDTSFGGNEDGFVVKLSAGGGHLWSTYLGGDDYDEGYGIAVDRGGNALVTGETYSSDWVSGGWDTSLESPWWHGFVVKLSASGSHLWSSYLGGSHGDYGLGIAVDGSGNALVTGETYSSDWVSGGWDTSFNGGSDGFVMKLWLHQPGVTIITHGWQLGGSFPDDSVYPMGQAVLRRASGDETNITVGSMFKHNPENGLWEAMDRSIWNNSNEVSEHIVLVYDWADESDDLDEGWLEAAADNLFASLLQTNSNLGGTLAGTNFFDVALAAGEGNDLLNLHFIGHSRGAVLNSLVTQRIDRYFPDILIDHVTSLDPHPWSTPNDRGYVDVNPQEDHSRLFTYNNVVFADNYYRQDGIYENDLDFDGVRADGAYNLQIPESVLSGDGSSFEHRDVYTWYYGTITQPFSGGYTGYNGASRNHDGSVSFPEEWYNVSGVPERDAAGFHFGNIAKGDRSSLIVTGSRIDSCVVATVFNGDFSYGNNSFGDEIPGWERHGGAVNAGLTDDGRLLLGELGLANYESIKHNPLYFPANIAGLSFEYQIVDSSLDDVLAVYIGNAQVSNPISLDKLHSGIICIPLDACYQSKVDTISFQLISGNTIDSDVYIDNIVLYTTSIVNTDFNNDGIVDVEDLGIWAEGFGTTDNANLNEGDADGDSDVDGNDFLAWQLNFGSTTSSGSAAKSSSRSAAINDGGGAFLSTTDIPSGYANNTTDNRIVLVRSSVGTGQDTSLLPADRQGSSFNSVDYAGWSLTQPMPKTNGNTMARLSLPQFQSPDAFQLFQRDRAVDDVMSRLDERSERIVLERVHNRVQDITRTEFTTAYNERWIDGHSNTTALRGITYQSTAVEDRADLETALEELAIEPLFKSRDVVRV